MHEALDGDAYEEGDQDEMQLYCSESCQAEMLYCGME